MIDQYRPAAAGAESVTQTSSSNLANLILSPCIRGRSASEPKLMQLSFHHVLDLIISFPLCFSLRGLVDGEGSLPIEAHFRAADHSPMQPIYPSELDVHTAYALRV